MSSLWLSGGVRVVVEYANGLAGRGHHVCLVTPAGTVDPDVRAEIATAVEIRESRMALRVPAKTMDMALLSWSLGRAVPPGDVVIATHAPTTVAGWLAGRLLGRGRPVWLCQDYVEMFVGRPIEKWLFRNAWKWHARILVVSDHSGDEMYARGAGARVSVVGEGLSHAELFRPARTGSPKGQSRLRTVLTMGDMRPRKGMFDLKAAIALVHQQIPDVRLLAFFKEEGHLDSVVPVESVFRPSRTELAAMYANCDLFVSASWYESFGLPPLEAMACGAPVVLTDSGGVRDYARHEENCLLVPPRDPQALAAAITRVLLDPALAERLRRAGPGTAARFTWEAAVARFEAALLDVVGKNRG